MDNFWDLYENYENTRLNTLTTRRRYRKVIEEVETFAKTDFLHVSQINAYAYKRYLTTLGLDDTTKDSRLRIVKSIGMYFEQVLPNYHSPFTILPFFEECTFYTGKDVPTLEDVSELLQIAEEHENFRAFLAITLALRLCLSLSEIAAVRSSHFVIGETACVMYVQESTIERRTIPVPDDVLNLIKKVYPKFFSEKDMPLFAKKNGSTVSPRTIRRSLEELYQYTELRTTLQEIRLLGIYLMLKSNKNKEEVAAFAGISDRWMFRYEKLLPKPVANVTLPNIRIEFESKK